MSLEAYSRAQAQSADLRSTEYRAFAKVTKALMEADDATVQKVEAVHINRSLWGVLADDCANPQNALPADLRARIIALSRWVGAYSSDVIRHKKSIEPLIDLNRIMMEGLSGKSP